MLCQHCGNAPCEPVCPVYATYHAPDGPERTGLQRCVGTRYCSNNCPYKVRYFNWFGFGESDRKQYAFPEPLNWQLNPDVTGRGKGVMEKCTFCVQRIREAENRAVVENRELQPDEFTVACAQGCPSRAITFGDAADPNWTVAQLRPARIPCSKHIYRGGLLEEGQPSGRRRFCAAHKGARHPTTATPLPGGQRRTSQAAVRFPGRITSRSTAK
jgi:Fe-S-cluster-containing dehydrogenase component